MSLLETPMTQRLWKVLGGTLFEEYPVVRASAGVGARRLDGLVMLDGDHRVAARGEPVADVSGQRVAVIQTKASRLGMYVLGQAVFSAELLRDRGTASVRSIALVKADDDVLGPLAERYDIEVVVDDGSGPSWRRPRLSRPPAQQRR